MVKKALDKYKGKLSPGQIAEGMNAASSNAKRLVGDADLLLEAGRFPSAAALAILAIEEAGKVSILRGMSVVQSDDEALDKYWREYRTHTKKSVTWLLPQLVAEGARSLDDFQPLFSEDAEHPFLLEQVKQISLYTDCLGNAHWSVPQGVIDEDLAKLLVRLARVFVKDGDVTPKEIELWVKHMESHMGSGVAVDYADIKQAILDWYADMQLHGLATHSVDEVEAFIFGFSDGE